MLPSYEICSPLKIFLLISIDSLTNCVVPAPSIACLRSAFKTRPMPRITRPRATSSSEAASIAKQRRMFGVRAQNAKADFYFAGRRRDQGCPHDGATRVVSFRQPEAVETQSFGMFR